MRISFRFSRTGMAQALLVMTTAHIPKVCAEQSIEKAQEKLSLSMEPLSSATLRNLPTSVRWNGDDYEVDLGVKVLMSVIRDPENRERERELALLQLAMLRGHLNGCPCLDELQTMYDRATDAEKKIILTCFLGSRDPRGIPVFLRAIDREQNMALRLPAASGLAGWNVRRGVAELIMLIESNEVLVPPNRMPYVRDNAIEDFRNGNARKGWGFPDEEIRKSIESRPGFDRDQFVALYTAEIKKWFAENEHRFPDWKPGDPLPEIQPAEIPDR